MLPSEAGGFYVRVVDLEALSQIDVFNSRRVNKAYVLGKDFSDETEIEIMEENVFLSNMEVFIEEFQKAIYPKEILLLHLYFTNGDALQFNCGELSLKIEDPVVLESFVSKLLTQYDFPSAYLLKELRDSKDRYITIYPN